MRLAADLYGTRLGIVTAAESNFNLAQRDHRFAAVTKMLPGPVMMSTGSSAVSSSP